MADENEQQLTDAIMGDGGGSAGPKGGPMIWVVLAVVLVIGAGGGFLASRMMDTGPSEVGAEEPAPMPVGVPQPRANSGEMGFFQFESITVNLNEERLRRFIRAKISLAIEKDELGEATKLLEQRMEQVKSWLNIYLAGCTLEDVRGPKNLRRIQREIAEMLNERLWPDRKPVIREVLLNEWQVQ